MATSEQFKALLRSHFSSDEDRFYTVALQVAAHEARKGNKNLAIEIRNILDKERSKRKTKEIFNHQTLNLDGLVVTDFPKIPKTSLVVSQNLNDKIQRTSRSFITRKQTNQNRTYKSIQLGKAAKGRAKTTLRQNSQTRRNGHQASTADS